MEYMVIFVEFEDNFFVFFIFFIFGGMGEFFIIYIVVLKRKKWCKIYLLFKRYFDLVIY